MNTTEILLFMLLFTMLSLVVFSYLLRIPYIYMRRKIYIIERGKKEYKMLYIPVYGFFLEISR